jgi:pSer/pThr/pTyr-binding forkhead associated (FHA) protein
MSAFPIDPGLNGHAARCGQGAGLRGAAFSATDLLLERLRVVSEFFSSVEQPLAGTALLYRRPAGDTSVRLVGERLTVGRDASCDLSFPMQWEMSRRHFAIWRVGSRYVLCDTGSANGTLVRGVPARIGTRNLRDGDLIDAGGVTFLFSRAQ